MIRAELTGLAEIAPEDPEPEFVDINADDEIAVTLQENNHIAILDRTGTVLAALLRRRGRPRRRRHRATTARSTSPSAPPAVPREPDAVQWIGTDRLATANEGD